MSVCVGAGSPREWGLDVFWADRQPGHQVLLRLWEHSGKDCNEAVCQQHQKGVCMFVCVLRLITTCTSFLCTFCVCTNTSLVWLQNTASWVLYGLCWTAINLFYEIWCFWSMSQSISWCNCINTVSLYNLFEWTGVFYCRPSESSAFILDGCGHFWISITWHFSWK